MRIFALATLALLASIGAASAACPSPLSITTTTGVNTSFEVSASASGNCESNINMDMIGGSPVVPDPCQAVAHTYTPISLASTTGTTIVAGTSAKKTYVCHIYLSAGGANNVALIEGTTSTCGTGTLGVIGGATAATGGFLLAANNRADAGDGTTAVAATTVNANNLCLLASAATQVSGVISTVQR